MDKVNFKKTLKVLYAPNAVDEWQEITVPTMNFLMIDGEGNPNTAKNYEEAVGALYATSYTLKFMSKRELSRDYGVSVLEGLWYADDMGVFARGDKDLYKWTMMIMQPNWIDVDMVERALMSVREKKPSPAVSALYFKTYDEGLSLQLLHVGSYDAEAPKLTYLHETYMPQHGYTFNGHHHEIYLGDPRRVAPEKLKTILRQPVTKN